MVDLVIRGGTVIDGSGGDPFEADVAIDAGKIVTVGKVSARGVEEIDAKGKIVTPGFVDPHSHYDAQATWSSRITPSSWHGVTTTLIGNCGVGFAPCEPADRGLLVKLMEGVEDIPEPVLTEGLQWNWRSFPDFLDALESRPFDLDIATQVPHAAVRVHVMGQRGVDREPATEADAHAMARLAAEGIRAGALGFSTSRTINHRTKAGEHTPTLDAEEAELITIARALPGGWLQVISDFDEPVAEFAMLRRLVEQSGRPMAITILQRDGVPEEWRRVTGWIADAHRSGLPMLGQVLTRPTGIILGFEISQNPFLGRPSYDAIADLPFAAKIAELRRPERRANILAEETEDYGLRRRVRRWDRMFPMSDPPNYEPSPEDSISALAAQSRRDPAEFAYDLLLENNGRTLLYRPLSNYTYGNLDTVHDMLAHDATIVGLGDGGAHVGILSDASALSTMLTHWTRDRKGERFALPWAVKRITRDSAQAIGLHDRGLVANGYKADLNVIDYDRLRVRVPEVVYDLPAGGRRLIQRADGYEVTIVSGTPVSRNGEATGALPGRLVRGARAIP
ncbi:MAG TPA: amidohydrolase family protein [Acetobacteraceae bacterium]|nr:amidohydrolase family protein [Acetobacteraceae bacterium]